MARMHSSPCFSPDGRFVFSPCGNEVTCFASATGGTVRVLSGHTAAVSGVCIHPTNTKQLLSSSLDGTIRAWDVDDGTCLKILTIGLPLVKLAGAPFPARCAARVFAVAIIDADGSELAVSAPGPTTDRTLSAATDAPSMMQRSKRKRAESNNPRATKSDAGSDAEEEQAVAAASVRGTGVSGSRGAAGGRTGLLSPWHVPTTPETEQQVSLALSYPLGDEAACLQVRPPAFAISGTVDEKGVRRAPPMSRLLSIDVSAGSMATSGSTSGLAARPQMQPILQRKGFVTGLCVRCYGAAGTAVGSEAEPLVPDVAVALTLRRRLFIFRSSLHSSARGQLFVHQAGSLLSAVSLHPTEPYVSAGELKGKLLTWHLPELEAGTGHSTAAGGGSVSADRTGLDVDGLLLAVGTSTPASSAAHWHAHAPWAVHYVRDGSFALSAGEESTLVLWQVISGAAGGASGPVKGTRSMTFIPRLGAPVRCVSSYSAAAVAYGTSSAETAALAASVGSGVAHVRGLPTLMYAVVLVDNTLVLINGQSLKSIWRLQGMALAGLPASLPTGLRAYYVKAAAKRREKALREALDAGDAALANRLRQAPSAFFPPAQLSSALHAVGRHLRAGLCVDPRTKALVLNGFPGRGSLQFYDHRRGRSVLILEVAPVNLISRVDEEPALPVSVRLAALSWDGCALATIEVAPSSSAGEQSVLKFWHWRAGGHGGGSWVLDTRVDGPHKTDVTVLLYAPGDHLVVTGSADRTFKTWARETRMSAAQDALRSAEGKAMAAATAASVASQGGPAALPAAPDTPTTAPVQLAVHTWACLSVGFYRDAPVTAGAMSGDGSLLALGFGPALTLWSPRTNTLRRVLVAPGMAEDGGGEQLAVEEAVEGGCGDGEDDTMDVAGAAVTPLVLASPTTGSARGEARGREGFAPNAPSAGRPPSTAPQVRAGSPSQAAARLDTIAHVAFLGLTHFCAVATGRTLAVWDVLSCVPAWVLQAQVTALVPDRLGLSSSGRFAVVVQQQAAGGSGHTALLFSAPSPVPLSVWPLPPSTCSAGRVGAGAGVGMGSPSPYSIAFAPPTPTTSGTGVPGNDLVVLGPMHGLTVLHTPDLLPPTATATALVSAVQQQPVSVAADVVTVIKAEGRPAIPSPAPAIANGHVDEDMGVGLAASTLVMPISDSSGTGASALRSLYSTGNSSTTSVKAGGDRAVSAHGEGAGDSRALLSLLDSLGSIAAFPSASAVADALLHALLPALPACAFVRSGGVHAGRAVAHTEQGALAPLAGLQIPGSSQSTPTGLGASAEEVEAALWGLHVVPHSAWLMQ